MGTSMRVNRTQDSGGGSTDTVDRLIEKETIIEVAGNATQYIPLEIGFHSFDIRSVLVTNDKDSTHELSIYDRKANGDLLYRSLQEKNTYDLAPVPGKDKDGTKTLHVYLKNVSGVATRFRVVIKLTQI